MSTDNFFLVGITGGIGSGKSLVCRILEVLGIPVYNADTRAKWLLSHDEQLKNDVINHFGTEAYSADGQLNRQFLAGKVFNDSDQVEVLNQLVHPRVGEDFNRWVNHQKNAAYLVKEAALLFESGSYKTLDQVITINTPEAIRIRRVMLRDKHRKEEDVKAIMEKQFTDQERAEMADFVINNDGQSLLVPKVLKLHKKLQAAGLKKAG